MERISAKLMQEAKSYGLELQFPKYESKKELLKEILLSDNERLDALILLMLKENNDIQGITIPTKKKRRFEQLLAISNELFNTTYETNAKPTKKQIDSAKQDYLFAEQKRNMIAHNQLSNELNERNELQLHTTLAILFAPKKQEIIGKIKNYEPLTRTELNYFYKSISPTLKALLNDDTRKLAQLILKTKKTVK